MSLESFFYAVTVVFLAELGDKTMLATIFLSAQYRRPGMVLLAAMGALTAATVIAVIIGVILAVTLPIDLILDFSGALFIIMGVYTMAITRKNEGVDSVNLQTFGGMFSLVFLAELGDKTQIAVLALAAQSEVPIFVFIGAFFGFLFVNSLGAVAGDRISEYAPIIWIKRVTGLVFIGFGILMLFRVNI